MLKTEGKCEKTPKKYLLCSLMLLFNYWVNSIHIWGNDRYDYVPSLVKIWGILTDSNLLYRPKRMTEK